MARAFQVPKTSLTHTLKGLTVHGLVEMRPNPREGRSKLVFLTDKGRSLRRDVISAMAPDFKRLQAGFDVERLAHALPVLRDLRVFLDEDRNRAPWRSD